MKILILHLSDAHFGAGKNFLDGKEDRIARAALANALEVSTCFVVISGDVALTGSPNEYTAARNFMNTLAKELRIDCKSMRIEYVLVPGNHDCDFSSEQDVRRALLATNRAPFLQEPQDDSVVRVLTSVQDNFFDFLADFGHRADNRLCWTRMFEVDGKKISFFCCNTAWMSKKDEQQGRIVFPNPLLINPDKKGDLTVSVFHHPLVWLEDKNGRIFKAKIHRISDMILTGHSHDPDHYLHQGSEGEYIYYLEGGVLQDPDGHGTSSFGVLVLDLDSRKQELHQYCWTNRMYSTSKETGWIPFHRDKFKAGSQFEFSPRFYAFLTDPGIPLYHPARGQLSLSDIYVHPYLTKSRQEPPGQSPRSLPLEVRNSDLISGEVLWHYLQEHNRVVLTGTAFIGKTALLKMLCHEAHASGAVPVWVKGGSIVSPDDRKMQEVIYAAFTEQYQGCTLDEYLQERTDNKVLLIDNLHRSAVSPKAKARFLKIAQQMCGIVVATADEALRFEDLVCQTGGENIAPDFEFLQFMEFGYVQREKMIRKWIALGLQEGEATSEVEIEHRIDILKKAIDTVVGRHLMPRLPIIVLTVLRMAEDANRRPSGLSLGSYGYIYEVVITKALATLPPNPAIDTRYKYLSELAYYGYSHSKTALGPKDLAEVARAYHEAYGVKISPDEMVDDLVSCHILRRDRNDGNEVQFRYSYTYCYFVARYLRDALVETDQRNAATEIVRRLCRNVYADESSNIIMFLAYLSQDPFILDELLQASGELYEHQAECNLGADLAFMTVPPTPPPELDKRSPAENREARLEALDEEEWRRRLAELENEIQTRAKTMIIAFRTIEILGQILRNFAGSLRRHPKTQLVGECYSLGLRMLGSQFAALERDYPRKWKDWQLYVGQFIRRVEETQAESERIMQAHQMLMGNVLTVIIMTVKRISYATGLEILEETYDEVLARKDSEPLRLIDTAVRLSNFRHVPKSQILTLAKDLESSPFAYHSLKWLVWEHLSLYSVPFQTRQALCSALDISPPPAAPPRERKPLLSLRTRNMRQ